MSAELVTVASGAISAIGLFLAQMVNPVTAGEKMMQYGIAGVSLGFALMAIAAAVYIYRDSQAASRTRHEERDKQLASMQAALDKNTVAMTQFTDVMGETRKDIRENSATTQTALGFTKDAMNNLAMSLHDMQAFCHARTKANATRKGQVSGAIPSAEDTDD